MLPVESVQKNRFPQFLLEITVRIKVPRENIHTGTLFLTVNSRENWKNLFYCIYFY
jgi:hypothetical protein